VPFHRFVPSHLQALFYTRSGATEQPAFQQYEADLAADAMEAYLAAISGGGKRACHAIGRCTKTRGTTATAGSARYLIRSVRTDVIPCSWARIRIVIRNKHRRVEWCGEFT
jgi:hypothetical protein